MKKFIVYLLILVIITTIGNQFSLPSLDTDIHTTSTAAILAMWLPVFAVIAFIPYLPYIAAVHMKSGKIQPAEPQNFDNEKCQAPEPEIFYFNTDPTPIFIGKTYTSIGCNCSVRVKSLKAQRPQIDTALLTPEYILN